MDRKSYQLEIPLTQSVAPASSSNGFENYHFVHESLPEINFDDIDISTVFCGKNYLALF